jgi:L-threonylcarbamoyladenylate synthase
LNTKWIKNLEQHIDEAAIREAGQIIRDGGLVAFPTETVYGLGGDALNPDSSRKIYAAKGRPSDNPLIVHICRLEDLSVIARDIPPQAEKLAKRFWPGPLTMILNKSDAVPKETTGGLSTVAVRFPSHPVALALISEAGGFVAAPSANTSGRPSPTLGKYVYEDMNGKIEMLLDGGQVGIGVESTIIDLTEQTPVILRPGYITQEMLEEELGEVCLDPTMFSVAQGQAPKAPGMKYKHYAPKGELTIVSGTPEQVTERIQKELAAKKAQGFRTGVIATQEEQHLYLADSVKVTGSRDDLAAVARDLFRLLREFDDEGIEFMYVEAFPERGIGQALMNRMLKAAGHRVIDAGESNPKQEI